MSFITDESYAPIIEGPALKPSKPMGIPNLDFNQMNKNLEKVSKNKAKNKPKRANSDPKRGVKSEKGSFLGPNPMLEAINHNKYEQNYEE